MRVHLLLVSLLTILYLLPSVLAKPRRFRNIAAYPSRFGLHYQRAPSRSHPQWLKTLRKSLVQPLPFPSAPTWPWGTTGQPGVAVGDFNGDGLDDIYVTNGPGAANSLFINLLKSPGGRLKFRDVATTAGVAAKDQDSTGVCYGDLNGDGHNDLVVLSEFDSNKIFLSKGDGSFRELNWKAATGDDSKYPSASCAIGDVDGDGRLDLLVSNGVPRKDYRACLAVPWDLFAPNQLFINKGTPGTFHLSFTDRSSSSGINDFGGDVPHGKFTGTWTATLIDINLDGNLDIVVADDQCGHPTKDERPDIGANRGAIRIQLGDGKGNFKSRTLQGYKEKQNRRRPGGETWMGLGFGDFNCDGKLDFFGSNFGDYHSAKVALGEGRKPLGKIGYYSSRWFLGDNSPQGFRDATNKRTGATVFGWGNAVLDYDNDGDQDIFMVGSLDEPRAAGSDNPNVIYKNRGCKARFSYDLKSLKPTGKYRNYNGMAIGDFNMDGYPDVVAASGFVAYQENLSRVIKYGSPLDKTAYFTTMLTLHDNMTFTWTGNTLKPGDMMVQINSETNAKNCWLSVRPLGMKGVVSNARVNRGGLGSTIIVRPKGKRPVMAPIVSGESFGSQHSPRRNFGLGRGCLGTVDILWPKGVRNRLYDVGHREMITFPEIPCSFTADWDDDDYMECVSGALKEMTSKGVISEAFAVRLEGSAKRALSDGE